MANKLLLWLIARFLDERARTRAERRRGPGTASPAARRSTPATPSVPKTPSTPKTPAPDPGQRLVGGPQPHDRIVLVPRERLVLVLEAGQPTVVARPKTYLWPPIVPRRRPMTLLVVTTTVVALVLTVRDLVTVDGHVITQVKARVAVRLSDSDNYSKLARTATEAGPELETQLLGRIEHELGEEIHVAVRLNRLADLRRLTLGEVLAIRGLPTHLGGGILDVESVEVTEVGWPAAEPAGADDAEPEQPTGPGPERLDLSTDSKLRRLWLTHSEVDLDGIASAQVDGASTVVAVPRRTPGQADLLAVKEAFRRQLDDRAVTVVATPATSYPELIEGWFRQIDTTPARLVAVRPSSRDGLRVIVDQALRSADGDGELRVGTPADRAALRQLLPHSRIDFVASDEAAALSERYR